jgi:hypothetical protein
MGGGIFLLVGLTLVGVSVWQFYNDRRFSQEGRPTEGIVVAKRVRTEVRTSGPNRNTGKTTHYEVTYTFHLNGQMFDGRDEVGEERWQSLEKGTAVEVLYLPTRPSSNRLAGPRPWLMKVVFGFVGLVFAVVGAVLVTRAVRDSSLESRLREHGVRANGTVTEIHSLPLRIDDVQQWRLRYEYQDSQGRRHTNTIDMPEDDAQQWKVGDAGRVLYDSAQSNQSVWLGRDTSA